MNGSLFEGISCRATVRALRCMCSEASLVMFSLTQVVFPAASAFRARPVREASNRRVWPVPTSILPGAERPSGGTLRRSTQLHRGSVLPQVPGEPYVPLGLVATATICYIYDICGLTLLQRLKILGKKRHPPVSCAVSCGYTLPCAWWARKAHTPTIT